MLLQYQSSSITWNPQPLYVSIQNRFGCIRTVKIRFTTKTFCLLESHQGFHLRLWAAQRASRAQLVLLGWLLQYKHDQGAHSVSQIEWLKALSHNTERLSLTSHSTSFLC